MNLILFGLGFESPFSEERFVLYNADPSLAGGKLLCLSLRNQHRSYSLLSLSAAACLFALSNCVVVCYAFFESCRLFIYLSSVCLLSICLAGIVFVNNESALSLYIVVFIHPSSVA